MTTPPFVHGRSTALFHELHAITYLGEQLRDTPFRIDETNTDPAFIRLWYEFAHELTRARELVETARKIRREFAPPKRPAHHWQRPQAAVGVAQEPARSIGTQ